MNPKCPKCNKDTVKHGSVPEYELVPEVGLYKKIWNQRYWCKPCKYSFQKG